MREFRISLALLFCTTSLVVVPLWGSPVNVLGIVVSADRAHVSDAAVSVGATIYGGDRLVTEMGGALQIRTRASRLYLSESSSASVAEGNGAPQVTLFSGTAVFSTSISKGLELLFKNAHIRSAADGPTIAQVRVAGPKELLITTRRGSLVFSVDEDSEVIPEGNTFRVTLDPPAPAAQGPAGVGAKSRGGPPRVAGRNSFAIVVVMGVAAVTVYAISEAVESPDKP